MTTDFPPNFPHDQPHQAAEEARRQGDLLRAALWDLVSTIEATGGVVEDQFGNTTPKADHDWIDLGEAYLAACRALAREPLVEKIEEDLEDSPRSEDLAP